MKLKDFIKELSKIKMTLMDTEIVVIAENGMLFSPEIKFMLNEKGTLDITKETVDKIVITV